MPFWIKILNQIYLPLPAPIFETFFTPSSFSIGFMNLIINQFMYLILSCKSWNYVIFMLPDSLIKSDVEPAYSVPFCLLAII